MDIETVIIGAGQAGLATGYHLQRCGREFVILDSAGRVGDQWRAQWDTLRLYTPVKYDGLPGLRFPGEDWTFPGKDQVADYLEAYAAHFRLPVRLNTRVGRLEPGDGGYVVTTDGERIRARNVVIATGTFGRTPYVPELATALAPEIHQLHSSAYRRPSQLPPGPVLVVGASHSGTDIAFELAPTHHTSLVGPDPGEFPMRIDHPLNRVVVPVLLFAARHLLTRRMPMGGKGMMEELRFHGGPMIRVRRDDLARRGVERHLAHVVGTEGGRPVLADGQVVDAATVIWCTGFRQVFDWVDLPLFDEHGWPREMRGVAAEAPGLFFCGLAFQYAFSSMILPGVGRDAKYVAGKIEARSRRPAAADKTFAA